MPDKITESIIEILIDHHHPSKKKAERMKMKTVSFHFIIIIQVPAHENHMILWHTQHTQLVV